jgi:ribosomal 50S subunit-recycling heat shock protein
VLKLCLCAPVKGFFLKVTALVAEKGGLLHYTMRIDKYLKVSRLIKRRTVAKDVCVGEKISINGRIVKPSAEVKAGDQIVIEMANHIVEVKVLATPNSVKANEAHTLYELIRDERRTES